MISFRAPVVIGSAFCYNTRVETPGASPKEQTSRAKEISSP